MREVGGELASVVASAAKAMFKAMKVIAALKETA